MRTRKAAINSIVNMMTYVINLILSFVITSLFLRKLGNELYGLNSLYSNILNYLSLMELGIGVAIVFSLYKPFADGDRVKIKGYLDYYKKFYRIIGIAILIIGIAITPFLKYFIKNQIDLTDAKIYFILMLVNTMLSYLFSYKLCILNVAQEGYIVSTALTVSKLAICIFQAVMFFVHPSFTFYIVIQIIINLTYYIGLNLYINRRYRWLSSVKGEIEAVEKNNLVKNIKALFMHKIGTILVFGTDNLVISAFLNLTVVGIFNSYNMVINGISGAVKSALTGVTASIGNLLTEKNIEGAYSVHKKLFFVSFWVVSMAAISLVNTLRQFVILWVGEGQVVDFFTITLLVANFYFTLMRSSVESFKDAGGVYYQDRYAPIFEGIINLVTSILFVKLIGLPGVLLGTFISNVTVVFWVQPKMVYKYIFKKPLFGYFKMYFKYLLISIVPLIATYYITANIKVVNSIPMFMLNCIINVVVINLFYLLIFRKTEEFAYFKNLITKLLSKIFPKLKGNN